MHGESKRNTGPIAFGITLLLIFIFAVAAFNRYETGGEPQAPLFPSDHSSPSSAQAPVGDNAPAENKAPQDNPITATVMALVQEQQAMQSPADDETNPSIKAQQLVEQAERLITAGSERPVNVVQPGSVSNKFESNVAYQQRMAEIQRLREQLVELKTHK